MTREHVDIDLEITDGLPLDVDTAGDSPDDTTTYEYVSEQPSGLGAGSYGGGSGGGGGCGGGGSGGCSAAAPDDRDR